MKPTVGEHFKRALTRVDVPNRVGALSRRVTSSRSIGAPIDYSKLSGSTITWRRPHVLMSRLAFNACYLVMRQHDRADEVVFISRQTNEARYDYAALAEEFRKRGWKTTMHLKKVSGRDLLGYAGHVLAEIRLLGRCKVVVVDRYDPVISLIDFECDSADAITSTNCANRDFPAKPIVLQLWHAFGAFKKFAFQTIDIPEGHTPDFLRDWRIHHNYSWVVCSGDDARPAFAEAFSYPIERVVPLNRPEYDELLELRSSLESESHAQRDRLRVLMAPTLRRSSGVPHPQRDLYACRAAFEDAVDADVVWAFHPLEEGLPAPGNVSDELLECDVVVTDYSSLAYEAYLLGKMLLFYVPDIGLYRGNPGLNRDPLLLAPGLCALDEGELVVRLEMLVNDPSSYPQDQLEHFIGHAFNAPETGTVAARIVDFLIEQSR